jgi:hypothetical protein
MKKMILMLFLAAAFSVAFPFAHTYLLMGQDVAEPGTEPEAEEESEHLLREDARFINVKGRIMDVRHDLKQSDHSRSAFVPKNYPGFFPLLENRKLEEIEEITRHGEKEVIVSGTVTVYRGKNYLLLTRFSVK